MDKIIETAGKSALTAAGALIGGGAGAALAQQYSPALEQPLFIYSRLTFGTTSNTLS